MNPAGYEFTQDWFDANIPTWDPLIGDLRPTRILEIGAFEGRSTCYLIERCSPYCIPTVVCVDTWGGGIEHDASAMGEVEARFDRNIERATAKVSGRAAVRKMKAQSANALARLVADGEDAFDLIYIDGSHQAPDVLTDAVLAYRLLRTGGLMVFDDYLWSMEAPGAQDPFNMPKPAIDAFINIFQRKVSVLIGPPIYQLYVHKTG